MNNFKKRGFFRRKKGDVVSDSFIMTFALNASDSITLPLVSSGTYDFVVDWGDGTTDTITAWNQAERVHSYVGEPSGDYVVSITGTCTIFNFQTVNTSRLKLKSIDSWGEIECEIFNFFNCNNLLSIIPFTENAYLGNSALLMFAWCFNLQNIPSGMFDLTPSINNFSRTFERCESITSIPSDLFANNTSATIFPSTFQQCSALTSIPSDLFANNTSATNFTSTFQQCSALTSIPSDLFANNTSANNFTSTFQLCSAITSIPFDLFQNNTLATNFSGTFRTCRNVTSIPSDLFANNTLATNFGTCFFDTRITSIPSDLFANNTLATNFFACFGFNPSLTSIGSGLFDSITGSVNFNRVFDLCTGLTSIPTDIFDECINAVNYSQAFLNCPNLSISVSNLVSGMTMTSVTTTNQMFSGCTNLTGEGQDLIDKPKSGSFVVSTATNSGSYRTFFNCSSLNDFATIPAEWK